MDAAAFERVYGAYLDFHAYFGLLFGRREALDHSRHYLQDLLVQSGERRNAENCPRRFRRQPGQCSGFSPNPPGTTTQS